MQLRFGLVSSDSHACVAPDAFTRRMSVTTWGDRIPQVREVEDEGRRVERWVVDNKVVGRRGVCNCASAMGDPMRRTFPQRWQDVPPGVYDPAARLRALDADGVDAEVLFFNDPVDSATIPFQSDPAFELACVQAYNDALAEWRALSDRYIPLALIPYLGGIEATTAEVRRAVEAGHGGIVMVAEPSMARPGLPHVTDPYWFPLWQTCQELGVPVNWHAHAGIALLPERWRSHQVLRRTAAFSVQPQLLMNLVLAGVLDRFPGLRLVCAETGMGWLSHLMQAGDQTWERNRLWQHGVPTRPSELLRRQVYANFWYERRGVRPSDVTATDRLMWASDYPHGTSTYPESSRMAEQVVSGLPEADRERLLWRNALELYGRTVDGPPVADRAATAGAGTVG